MSDSGSIGDVGEPWEFDDPVPAYARARQGGRPLFLYWSAKWCPPCAEMQVTVLGRAPFRARLTSMVPLAIDGDQPGAQAYGESVDADVYPSMLLLDAAARVLIRMPCGLDVATFCAVIDAALRRRTPIAELAKVLCNDSRALTLDDITLLAFHYWPLDKRVLTETARLPLLERVDAAALTVGSVVGSRALIWHLIERAGRPTSDTPPALRNQLFGRFVELLQSSNATFSILYYVLVGLEPVLALLCGNDETMREALRVPLCVALERFVEDATLTWTERLIAQSALVSLQSNPEPQGDESLRNKTRTLVAAADTATDSQIERQSVMNMAGHLLKQSGFREESITLFRGEIDKSPWPTYFMPYVAETYMELDEREEALRWWYRAYEETLGKTTRFELGVRHIAARVRYAPTERAAIEQSVTRLLAEHGDDADMGRGRMRKALSLLTKTLAGWQP